MAYILDDDGRALVADVKNFCDKEVKEQCKAYDESGEWPKEIYDKAIELGYQMLEVPEEYGGLGLPGETIQIVNGRILINGEAYKEGKDFPSINNPGMAANAITLEAGEYFVLGDNRNNSEDSRYGDIGKVNKKYITGKLWFQISPKKDIGPLED